MTFAPDTTAHPAGAAFDSIAEQYDAIFTDSLIGRAQREVVWNVLRHTFRHGDQVLELNCGTGEDALFLARLGVSVYACDASEKMIGVAVRRVAEASLSAPVRLEVRATENLETLPVRTRFDGVFSNFSGLNCVADLSQVAEQLSSRVRPAGRLVLCLSSRHCLWETAWYMAQGKPFRATRRWKGHSSASLGDVQIQVWYPTMSEAVNNFRPWFAMRSCRAVGLVVPPSYLEHLAQRHPRVLKQFEAVDRVFSTWHGLRVLGDHMLLVLERTQ